MTIKILPYITGSKSAIRLAHELDTVALKLTDSKYIPKPDDILINWGNGKPPAKLKPLIKVNPNITVDKRVFFDKMSKHSKGKDFIPQFWTDVKKVPNTWPLVIRKQVEGADGAGIVIADSWQDFVPGKLYVEYIEAASEFRVYVGRDAKTGKPIVIDTVQKKRENGWDKGGDWRIKISAHGVVYVRQGITIPPAVEEAALTALDATGLDFAGADVIWSKAGKGAFVLEMNTAPDMTQTTCQKVAQHFRTLFPEKAPVEAPNAIPEVISKQMEGKPMKNQPPAEAGNIQWPGTITVSLPKLQTLLPQWLIDQIAIKA